MGEAVIEVVANVLTAHISALMCEPHITCWQQVVRTVGRGSWVEEGLPTS